MNNRKAILVVAESLRINNTSSGIVSSNVIKLLHEAGFGISVITENNFDYPITWFPKEIVVNKINIPNTPLNFFDKIPKIKAYYSYLNGFSKAGKTKILAYKKAILNEIAQKKYDYIYLLGTGNSFLPYFIFPCSEIEIPYVVNIHDPYPNHLYPEPYKHKPNFLYKKQENLFNRVLNGAYKITAPSKLLLNDLAKAFPSIKTKGVVLPHIGTSLNGLSNNENDDKVTLPLNKINIIHAGNLLGPRNPEYLIHAISELNTQNKEFANEVFFTFFGSYNKMHKNIILQNKIPNVNFSEYRVSYKKSLELMAQAQANLVIEAISNFSPFLPGKVSDIAFAQKTIIALSPIKSEVNRVLGSSYTYTTQLNNVENIKKVLLNFYTDFKNNTIDNTAILELKNYVSVQENSKIIKEIFDEI